MAPESRKHRFEPTGPVRVLSPGTTVSHYTIIEKIGAGGMGVVYKAQDTVLRRTVALKFLAPQALGSEEDTTRLIREAQSAAALDHPNICTIHEIGKDEGYTFIVMAYIEGDSLAQRIGAGLPDVDEALSLTVQVARGLQAAHDKGIVHRDIKPANIMITHDGTVKIMDFGLAKSAGGTRVSGIGAGAGTVPYMSPEQTKGEEVDHRTDIWSLGVMLYQMLTGVLPFKGAYDQAVVYSILNEEPKALLELRADAPVWLGEILEKALKKDPENRYQRVDDMLADIERGAVRPRRRVRPRAIILIVAAAALGIGVTAIISQRPRLVIQPKRIYLACLPFENRTGQPDLDWMTSGIPDNLTADLAQSRFFRVMSLERLHQVVSEIGKDLDQMATAEALDLLGKATDLDAVAIGSFVRSGDEIRITMKIENPKDQELVGSTIVDDTQSRLLDLIDQLTIETKQIFGLSQEDIDRDLDRGVGLQRTRSVKAASDFSRGLEHSYRGAFLEAAEAFTAAIGADPDFAMAYAKASEAYKNLGYDEKAESLSLAAVDKAIELTDRVPPVDRTFILANHADIINSVDQAIESYKDFIKAYPDNPEGYYKLGLTYESISEWDLAVENLNRALDLDPKFGAARFELGKVLIRKNDLESALAELNHLLTYYMDMGNREGEAAVLNAIGIVHRHRNEFKQAIKHFEVSIEIKEELGDKRGVAASLGNLGLLYRMMGDRDRALAVLQRSLEIRREIGDKLGTSTALNKIGQIYQVYGRYDEALTYFERSYEIRKALGAKHFMASSLSDMAAVISASTGEYERAFRMDSTALALRREIGDDRGEVQSLVNIAAGLMSRGNFAEASACLTKAVAIGSRLADERLLAYVDYHLGRHCAARGRVDSALSYYAAAMEAQEDLDMKPEIAATLASMGSARRLKGDYTEALKALERACEIGEAVDNRDQVVNALLGKGSLLYDLGCSPGCDSVIGQLESYDNSTLTYSQRWELSLHKARRLNAGGHWQEALELAKSTVAEAKLIGVRIEGMLLVGEIVAEWGGRAESQSVIAAAIAEARAHSFRAYEAEGLRLMSHVLMQQGSLPDAAGLADDALDLGGRLGIDVYDYLLTRGDAGLAAQQSTEAVAFYSQALDRAVITFKEKCPARLREHYVERRRIGHYVRLLHDLLKDQAGTSRLRAYETVFGLD